MCHRVYNRCQGAVPLTLIQINKIKGIPRVRNSPYELSHSFAARLSQIDYDREMALLAEHDGLTLGIARYFADPDRLRAEHAIAVRSDWKGRGVGDVLMTRLIDVAGQIGIGELIGDVLHENRPMLDMCRELGFTITAHPHDATLLTVRKSLVQAPAGSGEYPKPQD
jgi:acetyltransferase